VAYTFQIGNNKINLLTEYENVTQRVLLLQNQYCRILNNFNMRSFFILSGLKIIGHGNPDVNLESLFKLKECNARV
jgi:hypothetical protein